MNKDWDWHFCRKLFELSSSSRCVIRNERTHREVYLLWKPELKINYKSVMIISIAEWNYKQTKLGVNCRVWPFVLSFESIEENTGIFDSNMNRILLKSAKCSTDVSMLHKLPEDNCQAGCHLFREHSYRKKPIEPNDSCILKCKFQFKIRILVIKSSAFRNIITARSHGLCV